MGFADNGHEAFNNSHFEVPEKQLFHYGNIIGLAPFHAGEQLPEAAGDPSAPGAAHSHLWQLHWDTQELCLVHYKGKEGKIKRF